MTELQAATALDRATNFIRAVGPGVAFSAAIAAAVAAFAPITAHVLAIPPMVLALLIGIALNPLAQRESFQRGMTFCVQQILRWSVALLGLRIALGEVLALGLGTLALVLGSMAITIGIGIVFARWNSQTAFYGALAGVGTAVCGASATLAAASVMPSYRGKEADVAFVVVAVNALSTVAMVLYPPLCAWLGLDSGSTGILLGATIHDVAQVVGAGYSVSETAGNTAVIVKLFRVLLLLPIILAVGWCFARAGATTGKAKAPVPVFALVFLALCLLNSAMPTIPPLAPLYVQVKPWLVEASAAGMLVAIAALGLGTSLAAIASLGWRHIATVMGTTLVLLVVVTAGLMILR